MARAVDSDSTGHRFDSCLPCQHNWCHTPRVDYHTLGGVPHIFKYGHQMVRFVRCAKCRQNGFRRLPSRIVYTWAQGDVDG